MSEPHEAWKDVHTGGIVLAIPARPQRDEYATTEGFVLGLARWCRENAINRRVMPTQAELDRRMKEAGEEIAKEFSWFDTLGLHIDEGEA